MDVLDAETLAILRAIPGAQGGSLLRSVLALFRRDLPDHCAEIRAATAAGDFEVLARVAHGLKGGSASLGAWAFADACRLLEQAGQSGDPAAVAEGLRSFETRLKELEVALPGVEAEA